MTPDLQSRIIEVHPEVCFWAMAGRVPLEHAKRRPAGKVLRRELLETTVGIFPLERLPGAGADDVLDALAAMWTAGRFAGNVAEMLSSPGSVDARGLEMAIWF